MAILMKVEQRSLYTAANMARRRPIDQIERAENHLNPWNNAETASKKEILRICELKKHPAFQQVAAD